MKIIHTKDVFNCFLCNKKGTVVYTKLKDRIYTVSGTWDFYRCKKCDLMWLNPQPRIKEIPNLYADYFTHVPSKKINDRNKATKTKSNLFRLVLPHFRYPPVSKSRIMRMMSNILRLSPTIIERVNRELRWVKYKENGKLLDVGCGNGEYLSWMKSIGWDVTGVEPDKKAVANASKALKIHTKEIDKLVLPEKTFDVITLNHVIEHVPDPTATLKACGSFLKDDGYIVMITPNTQGIGHRWHNQNWYGLDPPRHLFLFSPKSLKEVAERSNLQVKEHIKTTTMTPHNLKASRRIKMTGRAELTCKANIPEIIFWRGLGTLANVVRKFNSDEMVAILKKQRTSQLV